MLCKILRTPNIPDIPRARVVDAKQTRPSPVLERVWLRETRHNTDAIKGVNSTLVSNRVPVGPTIYGEILVGENFRIDDANFEHAEFRIFLYTRFI